MITIARLIITLIVVSSHSVVEAQPRPGDGNRPGDNNAAPNQNAPLDIQLRQLIDEHSLTGDAAAGRNLPHIDDPLPQLGKQLFFSKSLGGGLDTACVSCHHPTLGGADRISLSVGVGALNPDLLGPGRTDADGLPDVPRNAPTVFNLGLWDTGLFWDSRVEALNPVVGQNGAAGGIRTPDSNFGEADRFAGRNLATAQARFPVTSVEEMKTQAFENGSHNGRIRFHLGSRLGNYGIGEGELETNRWLEAFQEAFNRNSGAEQLVRFNVIGRALGEYQRSMVFTDSPWKSYVQGNEQALSDFQKAGAVLFFSTPDEGGAGCAMCHSGDSFSDGSHEIVAFPQIGPGKGDGFNDDFGRARETGEFSDRYRFRVPSLLNISETAPYGHAGAYATLEQVVRHYDNPRGSVENFFDDLGLCQLEQFQVLANCGQLYPQAQRNSILALNQLQRARRDNQTRFENINLNRQEVAQLVAFLEALTDPCVQDRECLSPWIANPTSGGPDGQQLNAVDQLGRLL